MIFYRPVGLKELVLISESDYLAFPPRLPDQPIFYPVLTFEYAQQIARDWNATSGDYAGFVTMFDLEDSYTSRFVVHEVGKQGVHQELWVPADELEEFNLHILGTIEIVAAYYGDGFDGEIDPVTNLPLCLKLAG